jgi:hypothetical protein
LVDFLTVNFTLIYKRRANKKILICGGMIEIFDDIRKIYKFSAPCPELSAYIEFFSESSSEKTHKHIQGESFTVKMFPSWTPTFYVNLGAPYHLSLGKKQYYIKPEKDVLILRDSMVERYNLPSDHIFTVKFFPGGLEAILGINQIKMADKVINLERVIPAAIIQRARLLNSFEERMALFQNYFLANYKRTKTRDHYLKLVQDTIEVYSLSNMKFNNSQLAEKMFVTSKTINRYFSRVIGTTPKNYFFIFRARTALNAYVANKVLFAPDDFGYYDMSHFYKDVVRFTGKKLVAYDY